MGTSKKQHKAAASKRSSKAAGMSSPGGTTRYALKRKGQVQPKYGGHGQRPLAACCYRHPCVCGLPPEAFGAYTPKLPRTSAFSSSRSDV